MSPHNVCCKSLRHVVPFNTILLEKRSLRGKVCLKLGRKQKYARISNK